MSKVNIKKLDSLSHNDTAATKLINDNFAALQQGIEDALSRTGKIPNFMDAELDMNSRRIINTGDAIDDTDVVTLGAYRKHIGEALSSAEEALNSEKNAAKYANEAKQAAEEAKEALDNINSKGLTSRVEEFTLGTIWEDSVDYEGYPYKYTIHTSYTEDYVNVLAVFKPADALSGNFAPVVNFEQIDGSQYVTLYCKKIIRPTPVTITYIR